MSPSVGHRSPVRSKSPLRARRRSPNSQKDRSPTRRRSSHRSPTKEKEKLPSTSRGRSPKRARSRSPAPHTKHSHEEDHGGHRSRENHKERHRERGVERELSIDKSERRSAKGDRGVDREVPIDRSERRLAKGDRGVEREVSIDRSERRSARGDRGIDREVSIDQSERKLAKGERGADREVSIDRSERRLAKGDKKEGGSSSSRSRHKRSASPMDHDPSVRPTSDSPSRASRSRARDEVTSPRGNEHRNENDSVAMMKAAEEALEAKKKEEPSFELSGKLAAETNRVRGVTLLFNEPSDARKPDIRWRLYVFKGGEVLNEPLYIHRQSCYLFGRERRVADVPTDHPSCSKQHAVIQFRQVETEKPDGMLSKQVRPYLIDLGSTNGTFLNENRVEPQRYYELLEKDTIKFGNSSREYVILHENSAE